MGCSIRAFWPTARFLCSFVRAMCWMIIQSAKFWKWRNWFDFGVTNTINGGDIGFVLKPHLKLWHHGREWGHAFTFGRTQTDLHASHVQNTTETSLWINPTKAECHGGSFDPRHPNSTNTIQHLILLSCQMVSTQMQQPSSSLPSSFPFIIVCIILQFPAHFQEFSQEDIFPVCSNLFSQIRPGGQQSWCLHWRPPQMFYGKLLTFQVGGWWGWSRKQYRNWSRWNASCSRCRALENISTALLSLVLDGEKAMDLARRLRYVCCNPLIKIDEPIWLWGVLFVMLLLYDKNRLSRCRVLLKRKFCMTDYIDIFRIIHMLWFTFVRFR